MKLWRTYQRSSLANDLSPTKESPFFHYALPFRLHFSGKRRHFDPRKQRFRQRSKLGPKAQKQQEKRCKPKIGRARERERVWERNKLGLLHQYFIYLYSTELIILTWTLVQRRRWYSWYFLFFNCLPFCSFFFGFVYKLRRCLIVYKFRLFGCINFGLTVTFHNFENLIDKKSYRNCGCYF